MPCSPERGAFGQIKSFFFKVVSSKKSAAEKKNNKSPSPAPFVVTNCVVRSTTCVAGTTCATVYCR